MNMLPISPPFDVRALLHSRGLLGLNYCRCLRHALSHSTATVLIEFVDIEGIWFVRWKLTDGSLGSSTPWDEKRCFTSLIYAFDYASSRIKEKLVHYSRSGKPHLLTMQGKLDEHYAELQQANLFNEPRVLSAQGRSAYRAGFLSYMHGLSFDSNPYECSSDHDIAYNWSMGWNDMKDGYVLQGDYLGPSADEFHISLTGIRTY